MSSNLGFIFPPPPPPPPRASASDSTYQGQGQAHGHSLRGGFNGRGRGHDRGRGNGDRLPRRSHPRKSWNHNSAQAQNTPQGSPMLAQSAYSQFQTVPHPSGGLTGGNIAPHFHHQHQAGGAQAPLSYGYMPQQAVQAQPPFTSPYPASHQPQTSTHGSALPLNSNGQYTLPSGHALPTSMTQFGPWQPSVAPNQTQMMGPPIRMGFNENSPSMTPALPNNNHPVNYAVSAFNAPQNHHISSANNNSPINGYQSHPNQSPNPYPPNNHVSRDHGTRGNGFRRGQHHRSDQSFRKPRNEAPRSRAPPAVPSFLSASLPPKPDTSVMSLDGTGQERKKKKRKYNVLGLTPRTVEHEESEDDVDEEIRLGNSIAVGGTQLKFEYRGRTSVLETPGDIAAWIEERKKRFPTKERIKEKEAEKERRWKEAKLKKHESLQAKQLVQEKQKSKKRPKGAKKPKQEPEQVPDGDEKAEKAKRKREKIMKKLKEQQEKLQKLDAEMAGSGGSMTNDAGGTGCKRKRGNEGGDDSKVQHDDKNTSVIKHENTGSPGVQGTDTQNLHVSQGIAGEKAEDVQMKDELEDGLQVSTDQAVNSVSKLASDPNAMRVDNPGLPVHHTNEINSAKSKREDNISSDSSSLDSSDSDSLSSSSEEPDQHSIRQQSSPAPSSNPKPHPNAPICRQFVRSGHCIRENKPGGCPYRHELPPRKQPKPKVWQKGPGMKKERHRYRKAGLYQRMLQNDKEKEDRFVLQAIKYMGDKGLFRNDC